MVPPVVIPAACVVIAIVIVVVTRCVVVNANKRLFTSRVIAEHAKVRAESAENTAKRIADVADNAITRTGEALAVAQKINKVSEQMDALMAHVDSESASAPSTGRHARSDLHALPGGKDGRHVA